ncbi:hypothetical protein [Haloferula sp. A504]|uniref:hypothetical protein n=1 Tax=Haloferula sp. A504 TaxID=3373601 RepID=UPI0031BBD278|nr:hypothetical protein [Verrucomicrobiaceae bacterium E54]
MHRFPFILLAAALLSSLAATVVPYNFPTEMPRSAAYQASIDGAEIPAIQTKRGAFLSFGMTAPVEVVVSVGKRPDAVAIRPLSAGIKAKVDGETVRFRLEKPRNLSVEIDGNLEDPLFVFANPVREAPDRSDPKVRFFEGGKVHDFEEIQVGDGETLYLEGGAIVRGVVRARKADKIAIRGPGILDAGTRERKINHLVLRECREALLEDFIILDPHGWTMHLSASESVTVRNTKVIGWRKNSDGLDIEYSKKVRVDGCFWRTNDDPIAVKAIYPPGITHVPFEEMINPETLAGHDVERVPGDSMGDILIENCVLWNDDGGQGFEIGFELRIDHIRDITFRDSDIIHVKGGAFTLHNGDSAQVEDVLIENVRVENPDRLVDFHVGLSIYSDDVPREYHRSNPKRKAPPSRPEVANNPWQWFVPPAEETARYEKNRGLVRNVTFRNVSTGSKPKKPSILNGFSPDKGISGIVFENLRIDGELIRSVEQLDLYQNHISGVEFRVTGE